MVLKAIKIGLKGWKESFEGYAWEKEEEVYGYDYGKEITGMSLAKLGIISEHRSRWWEFVHVVNKIHTHIHGT